MLDVVTQLLNMSLGTSQEFQQHFALIQTDWNQQRAESVYLGQDTGDNQDSTRRWHSYTDGKPNTTSADL